MPTFNPSQEEFDELGRRIKREYFSLVLPQEGTAALGAPATTAIPGAPTTPARVPRVSTFQPAQMTPTETEAMQVYRSMPQYQPPGKLRRVLAAIAGGGEGYLRSSPMAGVEAARGILEAPYRTQMTRWQERMGAIKPQLELERGVHERGVDISKLDLEALGLGVRQTTAEAAWIRANRPTTEESLLWLYQGLTSELGPEEGLSRYQAITGKYPPRPTAPYRRWDAKTGKYVEVPVGGAPTVSQATPPITEKPEKSLAQIEQEAAARARGTATVRKPGAISYITPQQQEKARVLAIHDVLSDTELMRQLPGVVTYSKDGKSIESDYIGTIVSGGKIIGYELLPFDPERMDQDVYNFLKSAISTREQKRLDKMRGAPSTVPTLFEDVEEPDEGEEEL